MDYLKSKNNPKSDFNPERKHFQRGCSAKKFTESGKFFISRQLAVKFPSLKLIFDVKSNNNPESGYFHREKLLKQT